MTKNRRNLGGQVMKPPKSSCAADSRALGVEVLLLAQTAVRELNPTVGELKVRILENVNPVTVLRSRGW